MAVAKGIPVKMISLTVGYQCLIQALGYRGLGTKKSLLVNLLGTAWKNFFVIRLRE